MRTACVYHSVDLDGWMSAAIVKRWFLSAWRNGIQTDSKGLATNQDELDLIGHNYGQPLPDLDNYGRIILCDISFPPQVMNDLQIRLKNRFIWVDHHVSAINNPDIQGDWMFGLRDTKFAACELAWKFFFPEEEMPEIVRLLGRYDCFGHKGTNEEGLVLEFQYGARQIISNYEDAYRELMSSIAFSHTPNGNGVPESTILEAGRTIYKYLCTEAKQTYRNGFLIKVHNRDLLVDYRFICINRERFNPVNFDIDYHKDGYDGCACFHYADGMWNFSLYNDNGQVDVSQIAKQYGGGGHKGAAGFRLTTEQFTELIS